MTKIELKPCPFCGGKKPTSRVIATGRIMSDAPTADARYGARMKRN